MKLYYIETLNPRKACAVAKHVVADVEYVKVDGTKNELKSPEHLARNPNGLVPVLVDGDRKLWESVAIMLWLAAKAGSELWPANDPAKQAEVMRWVSWDACHFVRVAGPYYFEYYVKPMFGLGAPDEAALAKTEPGFHRFARVLDAQLEGRRFLATDTVTIADFCVGATLPNAEQIHLPLSSYRNIRRWHDGLMELEAWRNPWPSS